LRQLWQAGRWWLHTDQVKGPGRTSRRTCGALHFDCGQLQALHQWTCRQFVNPLIQCGRLQRETSHVKPGSIHRHAGDPDRCRNAAPPRSDDRSAPNPGRKTPSAKACFSFSRWASVLRRSWSMASNAGSTGAALARLRWMAACRV
jgi:hypothetical protein